MEMIEKCARAICRLYALDEFEPDAVDSKAFEFWIDNYWKEYASDVRTVIQAMREPSEEMVLAGALAMDGSAAPTATTAVIYGQPKKVFQAMIDEILSPGKSGMGEG